MQVQAGQAQRRKHVNAGAWHTVEPAHQNGWLSSVPDCSSAVGSAACAAAASAVMRRPSAQHCSLCNRTSRCENSSDLKAQATAWAYGSLSRVSIKSTAASLDTLTVLTIAACVASNTGVASGGTARSAAISAASSSGGKLPGCAAVLPKDGALPAHR